MPTLEHQTDVWSDKEFVHFGATSGPMSPSGLSTSSESEFYRQWSERITNLRRLRSLRDNWDSEGAEAPRPEVVDSIEVLFGSLRSDRSLPPPSRIVASPSGSVIIEWQIERGTYLEAECSEPYHAEWMLEVPNRPTTHWPQFWGSVQSQRQRGSWYRAA